MLVQVAKELGRSVRYALDGWSRTARACCLIMAGGAAAAMVYRFKG